MKVRPPVSHYSVIPLLGFGLLVFDLLPAQEAPTKKGASLSEMIRNGTATIKTDDPEEAKRLREVARMRGELSASAQSAAEMQLQLRRIFEQPDIRNRAIHRFARAVTPKNELICHASVIAPKQGILVAPLDQIEAREKPQKVMLLGESVPVDTVEVLSREDNLAILRCDLSVIKFGVELDTEGKSDAEVVVGTFVGALAEPGRWITGNVTTGAFRVPEPRPEDEASLKALKSHWQKIGLKVSEKREGFPEVYSSDLQLSPEQCGSAVYDLQGNLIGIAVSRADYHASYVLPIAQVQQLVARYKIKTLSPK